VAESKKRVAVVGGDSNDSNGATDSIVAKALTLQIAAKSRHVEAFLHLLSLGARLDELGTSIASIRSLLWLVTQGPDAPALLRLFLNTAHLASQLSEEMRKDALIGLLQGYIPPSSSLAPSLDEYIDFARTLLDAGASPELFRPSSVLRLHSTSTLSTAARTLSPELFRLLLDHGACPNGPPDVQPPPLPRWPLHVPLCAVAHAMATSLLSPSVQTVLRQMVDMLLDSGADINPCVPYVGSNRRAVSFTAPLVVFLDTVDCWDDDGGGLQALDNLHFLLDRGSCPEGPPRHPAYEDDRPEFTYPVLFRVGYFILGRQRHDPIRDLLDRWGVASPAFASALELLVGHPSRRGGVRAVAEALAKYDTTLPSSSPSSSPPPDAPITTQNHDAILDGWRRLVSAIARLLSSQELNEFLYVYVVRKGTCPRKYVGYHSSGEDEIGDLARATVVELIAAGADINHRRPATWRDEKQGDCPTALHAICIWLAGRAAEEEDILNGWKRSCYGFRHTPFRAQFMQFLAEACGADREAKYHGRTPAEIIVQLRRPELDNEETRFSWGRRDADAVREARESMVDILENAQGTTS
jgi:hypothetical protein